MIDINELDNFFVGVILGSLICSFVMGFLIYNQSNEGRAKCELNLPRTEQCVKVWVPQSKETK